MVKILRKKQQQKLHNVQKPIYLNKRRSDQLVALSFILPSVLGVLVFIGIPFLDVIRRSFFGAMNGQFVGLKNYITIFQNDAFKLASTNTLKFIALCIPLLVSLSLGVALLINQLGKKAKFFKTTFLLPMAIPVASVVLIWRVLFDEQGILSKWLVEIGGQGVDWMNSEWAFWILVGSYIWRNLGYDMVLWLAGLSTLSEAVYEAAKVDGANRWQCLIYMTIPQMLPAIFTIVILSLLNSFKVFREAYLIAGNYPHDSMYMLQHLFNNWFTALDIDKLSAAAIVVASTIFILTIWLQKIWGGDEDVN